MAPVRRALLGISITSIFSGFILARVSESVKNNGLSFSLPNLEVTPDLTEKYWESHSLGL
ncbi:hypothetical protein [uncultured Mediterranean phage]|nr:hypothetical protein [uncultured Mediterranean phage]